MLVTWTLRLYDSEGIEIAWVRADPYEWEITHPDESSARFDVEAEIAGLADAHERVGGNPEMATAEWRLVSSRFVYHGETPKEHLEWVEENMQYADGVESTVLTDE
jgi:hypothetical protein